MADDKVVMTEIERARLDWMAGHLRTYLSSGGKEGHIVDLSDIGGHSFTTTLLLRTKGAKSGETRTLPLIYGCIGGEVVIVASKGGADVHPAWYLNIKKNKEVAFQIGAQAFRASAREPEGAERQAIWSFMEKVYPPYAAYQAVTSRVIPILMLKAVEPIGVFKG